MQTKESFIGRHFGIRCIMLLLPAPLINKRGIPCMPKHADPTDQLTADAPSCLISYKNINNNNNMVREKKNE